MNVRFFRKKPLPVFFLVTIALAILFSSFRLNRINDDVWKLLGISRQSGNEKIKSSFLHGYLYYYGVKNIKNMMADDRSSLATNLLVYTKQYVSSDLFQREYEEMRKREQPQEPVMKPLRTLEEIQKAEIGKTERSIREMEKNRKDMPQFAKSIEPTLAILKDNLKKFQDPQNPYFAAIAMGEKYEQESATRNFHDRITQWEAAYPASVEKFVASRLQKLLDNTRDIDFNAELIEKDGKKKFVNPEYEAKNAEWKQGFRAGRNVTAAARAFAEKWLEELSTKL